MQLTLHDKKHIFHQLSQGTVPERGLDAFAVGIEPVQAEFDRLFDLAVAGEGVTKFVRGGYGCGKTFAARLALADAARRGFATSFAVVSDSDFHLHKFDDVYRKIVTALSTPTCPRGALGDILDRWVVKVEDALIATGVDEEADDFDDKVNARLALELDALTRGQAPADFVRVVQSIFALKQRGEVSEAAALISWLEGSGNVAAAAKRVAGVRGEISSRDALAYLRGVLAITRAAGYSGVVAVVDEVETILRVRRDVRAKSLNGVRQIVDDAGSFPGLVWLFTGTPEFFEGPRGVAGLAPLDDRIRLERDGRFTSLRQPQLELRPFDADRLRDVALKLREIYPTADRDDLEARVSDAYIDRLVESFNEGLKKDVGAVPRHFLRKFVRQLDLSQEDPSFDAMEAAGFGPDPLDDVDRRAEPVEADDDLAPVAVEDVW